MTDANFSPEDYPISDDPESVEAIRERLLKPQEVAEMFRVDPRTVARWARMGKLPCQKTLGGHRRYREQDVLEALDWSSETAPVTDPSV